MTRLLLVLAALLLCLPARVSAATYFVAPGGNDAGAGTIAAPWRNVQNAITRAQPGDTVYLRGGTYFTTLAFNSPGVTLAGYLSELATLQAWGGAVYIVSIGPVADITLRDLVIEGAGADGDGVSLHDASLRLTMERVEVRNAYGNGIIGGGSHHRFIDLRVHHNGRCNCPLVYPQGALGVYFTGSDSVFTGEYYANLCYGLRIVDSSPARAARNVARVKAYDNGPGRGLAGTSQCGSSGGGIAIGDSDNRVELSEIRDNSQGIDVVGLSGKVAERTVIDRNTFTSNVSYDVGDGLFAGSQGTQITNNTLTGAIRNFTTSGQVQANNSGAPPLPPPASLVCTVASVPTKYTRPPLYGSVIRCDVPLTKGQKVTVAQ